MAFSKITPIDFHWGALPFLQLQRNLGRPVLSYMLIYLVPMAQTGKGTWRYRFSQFSVPKNHVRVAHIPQDKGSNNQCSLPVPQSRASQNLLSIWIPWGSCQNAGSDPAELGVSPRVWVYKKLPVMLMVLVLSTVPAIVRADKGFKIRPLHYFSSSIFCLFLFHSQL